MIDRLGEIAALGTSVCWTVTALAFEYAGKRIGTLALNILRLAVALLIFAIVGLIVRGNPIPLDAPPELWFWLSLSGLVGFVFGDIFLFQSYIDIGARKALVVFVSSPLITALLGFGLLGEKISPVGIAGMCIVIAAITWVVFGSREDTSESLAVAASRKSRQTRGVLFALLGALGQSGGLVLSKMAAPSYDAIAATQIRVIAGLVGFTIVALFLRRSRECLAAIQNIPALKILSIGAFFGPFLGVSLGMFAIQRTSSGIAATLMGLTPILILVPSVLIRKERITIREVLGSALAVFGSALIFLH
ncbi:MAG TPA: DMT family transporter, partial [Treponemataceae bacterium]|nr:DMT family transporter [Treponemataceae bacterium]